MIVNAVPLLPGYRWHRTARIWRTRGLGELSTGSGPRRLLDLGLRESRGDWSRHDPAFVDMIWDHLDRGTFGAILRALPLGSADELAAAGERLGSITAPAWSSGGCGTAISRPLRAAPTPSGLPNSELLELPDAGHWPWIDAPEVIDRVIRFLATDEEFRNS